MMSNDTRLWGACPTGEGREGTAGGSHAVARRADYLAMAGQPPCAPDHRLPTVVQADQDHASELENLRLNLLYRVSSQTARAILRTTSRAELFADACRLAVEHGGLRMA